MSFLNTPTESKMAGARGGLRALLRFTRMPNGGPSHAAARLDGRTGLGQRPSVLARVSRRVDSAPLAGGVQGVSRWRARLDGGVGQRQAQCQRPAMGTGA